MSTGELVAVMLAAMLFAVLVTEAAEWRKRIR